MSASLPKNGSIIPEDMHPPYSPPRTSQELVLTAQSLYKNGSVSLT